MRTSMGRAWRGGLAATLKAAAGTMAFCAWVAAPMVRREELDTMETTLVPQLQQTTTATNG